MATKVVSISDRQNPDKTVVARTDFAMASFSRDLSDLNLIAQVTGKNEVTATLLNKTGSTVSVGEGTLHIRVFRRL